MCIRLGPRSDPTGSKVKVTGVKVIFKNLQYFKTPSPISSKLGVCIRLGPRSDHTGSKVKVMGVKIILKNLQYLYDP